MVRKLTSILGVAILLSFTIALTTSRGINSPVAVSIDKDGKSGLNAAMRKLWEDHITWTRNRQQR